MKSALSVTQPWSTKTRALDRAPFVWYTMLLEEEEEEEDAASRMWNQLMLQAL